MASLRGLISKTNKAAASDPSKMVTGTKYMASGQTAPDTGIHSEIGSAYYAQLPDPVPELTSAFQAQQTYLSMYRSDVSVRVGLRCIEGPILGGDYTVDPYDETPQSAAIRDFVEWQLFSAAAPWLSTLSQILKMFRYGFQIFEPVWELREWAPTKSTAGANRRMYTSLKRMAVRPVGTIQKIYYDDYGDLLQIDQNAIGKDFQTRQVTIPASKLVVFTFDKDGGDVRGESVLRPAYPHWYMKTKLYAIDGIQKEHHGIGIPFAELQPGASDNDKKFARSLLKALRVNEQSYFITNPNIKVGYAELQGNLTDALISAKHHDHMIMKNILIQFLDSDAAGGRATSATAMDMMLKSTRYIGNYICDQFNYHIIPQMVGYNFNTDQFPQLRVRNIGEAKDLQMWSAAMANLINAEAIQVDDDTEQFIRKVVDMPKRISPRIVPSPKDTKENILLQGQYTGNGTKGTTGASGQVQTGNVGVSPGAG